MSKKVKKREAGFDPVYCLASIFTARRDLLDPIRREVMGEDSPVTIDEADVLTFLYGNQVLDWNSLPADEDGFVAVGDLRVALVHDGGLFSRRIRKLQNEGLVEGKQPSLRRGSRRYVNGLRITDAGIKVAKTIWDRYSQLAGKILAGLSQADLKAQCRVNQHISQAIRTLTNNAQMEKE
jgi:DNA-binding MarR family transcriptional regulator